MIGISERGKLGTWRLLRACEMLDGKAYLDGITKKGKQQRVLDAPISAV